MLSPSMRAAIRRDGLGWHPRLFAVLVTALLLLTGSWLWEPSRAAWDALDAAVFYCLNGMLAHPDVRYFWAVANYRAFDLIPACLLLGLFWHFWRADQGRHRRPRAFIGLGIAVMILLLLLIQRSLFDLPRQSPSLVLQPAWLLTELVPAIDAKDRSGACFPGDHGAVMMMMSAFLWFYAGWRYGLAGGVITLLFILPRLVGGAHWLTDIAIGSTSLALLAVLVWLATPLHARVLEQLERWVPERLLRRL